MVLAITQTKAKRRFDDAAPATFTATGSLGAPNWFIRNYLYQPTLGVPLLWEPPNQTDSPQVTVRDNDFWSWTLSSGIARDASINKFTKSGAEGMTGASGTAIGGGKCHIEGVPHDEAATVALFLQSGSPAGYDFFSATDIEHALVFGQNGAGQIYERGVLKKRHNFSWETGDRGIVEQYGDFVRYYKISDGGSMTLLRSARSLLSGDVTPGLTIFHTGGAVNEVLVWNGVEAVSEIDLYAVLSGEVQDWQNQATFDSLAEKTLAKDKREDFTYFSDEKNLMTLSLNLAWREEEEYQAFKEFFQYHDQSRPFIFVDKARNKLLPKAHPGLAPNELFALFVSSFKDNPLGAATYGVSVDIRQMIDPPNIF